MQKKTNLVPGNINLITGGLITLLSLAALIACIVIVVSSHSIILALIAILGIAIVTFLTSWCLFRSLKANQGNDELDEIRLRFKEMVRLTPGLNPEKKNHR